MKNRTALRLLAAGSIVVVGAFATIGEGSTGSTGSNNNRAPNADATTAGSGGSGSATTVSAEGAEKAKPIPVGTEIKVSSGWDFKVNSAELNADQTVKNQSGYDATPDDGKQFVLVNVTMVNNSGKPDSPLTNLDMSLLPSSGVAIDQDFTTVAEGCDQTTQLQPGAKYTCNAVFQSKPDEIDTSLLLVEPVFTLDKNGAQRFFNLK